MSAFLGPIHFIVYEKILYLNNITNFIIDEFSKNSNLSNLRENIDAKYPNIAMGELSEIIDHTQIHAWLNNQVSIIEKRSAAVIKEVLNETSDLETLKNIYRKFGEEARLDHSDIIVLQELFNIILRMLLDGMPCDKGIEIISNDDSDILWKVNLNAHTPYLDEVGLSGDDFIALRNAWLEGFFDNSNIEYQYMGNNTFKISEM